MLNTFEDQLDDSINMLMDDYMEELLDKESTVTTVHTNLYCMNWYNNHSNK